MLLLHIKEQKSISESVMGEGEWGGNEGVKEDGRERERQ